MIENSVIISPKKAADESNAIYKWLLGIRKEILVLVCQNLPGGKLIIWKKTISIFKTLQAWR